MQSWQPTEEGGAVGGRAELNARRSTRQSRCGFHGALPTSFNTAHAQEAERGMWQLGMMGMHTSEKGYQFILSGLHVDPFSDIFHALLRTRWVLLLMYSLVAYTFITFVFALLYWADPTDADNGPTLRNAEQGSFPDCWYFSLQTLSTVGYGYFSPNTPWAHTVTLVESWAGLVFTALVTGTLFAKLSRPIARIRWADKVGARGLGHGHQLIVPIPCEAYALPLRAPMCHSIARLTPAHIACAAGPPAQHR
jgi:hypothetical protein